jgi:site-specific DNA-cytosine methylase
MDDGLSPWIYRHRQQRLKALGNAIVPQVVEEIFRAIQNIETSFNTF